MAPEPGGGRSLCPPSLSGKPRGQRLRTRSQVSGPGRGPCPRWRSVLAGPEAAPWEHVQVDPAERHGVTSRHSQ